MWTNRTELRTQKRNSTYMYGQLILTREPKKMQWIKEGVIRK